MVSIAIFREIGPVITALICAGRISSGIGAELGAMKVTEQIDAMEVSGTNPMKFVVTTRVLATTLTVPVLVIIADTLAMLGTYVAINLKENMSVPLFIELAFNSVDFIDVIPATIKSFFFGYFIGLIGCYKGYQTHLGTESVGMAANSAVVSASFAIFIIDLIAVEIAHLFYAII
jgi:phospholipid/cholesterol/gamma-HCH transport system permease protein